MCYAAGGGMNAQREEVEMRTELTELNTLPVAGGNETGTAARTQRVCLLFCFVRWFSRSLCGIGLSNCMTLFV